MIKKIIFLFLLLLNINAFAKNLPTFQIDSDKDEYDDTSTYFFRYDVAFQKKHQLPKKHALKLEPGLEGIEIALTKDRFFKEGALESLFPDKQFTYAQKQEINKAIPSLEMIYHNRKKLPVYYHYDCYIDLYVDDNLKINYPYDARWEYRDLTKKVTEEGLSPVRDALISQQKQGTYESLIQKKLTEIDEVYYHQAYLVEQKNLNNPSQYHPLFIDNYRKQQFVGVNFIQIGPDKGCELFSSIKSDAVVLIKKTDNTFYRFKIPNSILPYKILNVSNIN